MVDLVVFYSHVELQLKVQIQSVSATHTKKQEESLWILSVIKVTETIKYIKGKLHDKKIK